jgi:hypothetical protein
VADKGVTGEGQLAVVTVPQMPASPAPLLPASPGPPDLVPDESTEPCTFAFSYLASPWPHPSRAFFLEVPVSSPTGGEVIGDAIDVSFTGGTKTFSVLSSLTGNALLLGRDHLSGFHDDGTNEWSLLSVWSLGEGCVVDVVETGMVRDFVAVTIEVSYERWVGLYKGVFKVGEHLNGFRLSFPHLSSSV